MSGPTKLELQLYGAFSSRWSDGTELPVHGAKHRGLLAMLATASNGTHSRSWLQEHLWSRSGEDLGRQSLRRAISDLKRLCGSATFQRIFDVSNIDIRIRLDHVRILGTERDGIFLEGLVIREPGFEEWLRAKRAAPGREVRHALPLRQPTVVPSLAVVPFNPVDDSDRTRHFGDLLALEVTRAISRSRLINVISHLSCRNVSGPYLQLADIRSQLDANYLIHGSLRSDETAFRLDADFIDATTGHIGWTRTFIGSVKDVLMGESDIVGQVAAQAGQSVLNSSVDLARSKPLPEVEGHALFMSSIAQMHQHRLSTFSKARTQLEELIGRNPRQSELHAWLAKWHVLGISQGWSTDPAADMRRAAEISARALDLDPACSISLTVDGMIQGSSSGDTDIARERFTEATQINPNQGLAWLMFSRMHAFLGNGAEAVHFAQRAIALSPLDPHRYFYDIIAALAHQVNDDNAAARALAEQSIAVNPRHISSYRTLAIAQELGGDHDAARRTIDLLRRMEPDLTVERYLSRHPAGLMTQGRKWAYALRNAGLPER